MLSFYLNYVLIGAVSIWAHMLYYFIANATNNQEVRGIFSCNEKNRHDRIKDSLIKYR